MISRLKSLSEINHQAIKLLAENMGLADTLRFVGQFSIGHGNYTEEREALFRDLTLDDILAAIERRRTEPAK